MTLGLLGLARLSVVAVVAAGSVIVVVAAVAAVAVVSVVTVVSVVSVVFVVSIVSVFAVYAAVPVCSVISVCAVDSAAIIFSDSSELVGAGGEPISSRNTKAPSRPDSSPCPITGASPQVDVAVSTVSGSPLPRCVVRSSFCAVSLSNLGATSPSGRRVEATSIDGTDRIDRADRAEPCLTRYRIPKTISAT